MKLIPRFHPMHTIRLLMIIILATSTAATAGDYVHNHYLCIGEQPSQNFDMDLGISLKSYVDYNAHIEMTYSPITVDFHGEVLSSKIKLAITPDQGENTIHVEMTAKSKETSAEILLKVNGDASARTLHGRAAVRDKSGDAQMWRKVECTRRL